MLRASLLKVNRYLSKMFANTNPSADVTGYNTGEVAVKRGSGTTKIRKGQTEEEFQEQKKQFWATGPSVSKTDILAELMSDLSLSKNEGSALLLNKMEKIDREKVFYYLNRLYYDRQYDVCLQKIDYLEKNMNIPPDFNLALKKNRSVAHVLRDLQDLRDRCQNHLP